MRGQEGLNRLRCGFGFLQVWMVSAVVEHGKISIRHGHRKFHRVVDADFRIVAPNQNQQRQLQSIRRLEGIDGRSRSRLVRASVRAPSTLFRSLLPVRPESAQAQWHCRRCRTGNRIGSSCPSGRAGGRSAPYWRTAESRLGRQQLVPM